ncbi:hypothetical protein [Nitrobacter sp.]
MEKRAGSCKAASIGSLAIEAAAALCSFGPARHCLPSEGRGVAD